MTFWPYYNDVSHDVGDVTVDRTMSKSDSCEHHAVIVLEILRSPTNAMTSEGRNLTERWSQDVIDRRRTFMKRSRNYVRHNYVPSAWINFLLAPWSEIRGWLQVTSGVRNFNFHISGSFEMMSTWCAMKATCCVIKATWRAMKTTGRAMKTTWRAMKTTWRAMKATWLTTAFSIASLCYLSQYGTNHDVMTFHARARNNIIFQLTFHFQLRFFRLQSPSFLF